MNIDKIRIYPIDLPFSFEFAHALKKRGSVKNIVVEVIAENGKIRGYGEGAPRSFVTGESQKSSIQSISGFVERDHFPWRLENTGQLWKFIDRLSHEKSHNAATCALETALLDALGISHKKNIINYFPKDFITRRINYGVPLPLADQQTIGKLCVRARKMKIRKLKLKMGKNLEQNRANLEALRTAFGEDYDLKVDINGVWNYPLAFKHASLLNHYQVKVVEQPMAPDDPEIARFAGLMQKTGIILMADESACSLNDIVKIAKDGYYKMINVRLSKNGGFRNSFKMIDFLRRHKISFQIGCHLGESGILSAAGRVLCLLCNDARYYDGSYDEFLLAENITTQHVSFEPGGEARPLNGPGLGVDVSRQILDRLSDGPPIVIEKP